MGRDLYRSTHKAIRADMFEVSGAIAVTDFSDLDEVDRLHDRFAGLVGAMEHHATIEAEHIHPMAREVAPEIVAELDAEHVELEGTLARLRDELWSAGRERLVGASPLVVSRLQPLRRPVPGSHRP